MTSKNRRKKYFSGYSKTKWWIEKRYRIYVERGGICEICGNKYPLNNLQLHHKILKSKNGRDIDNNLLLLCPKCHNIIHK